MVTEHRRAYMRTLMWLRRAAKKAGLAGADGAIVLGAGAVNLASGITDHRRRELRDPAAGDAKAARAQKQERAKLLAQLATGSKRRRSTSIGGATLYDRSRVKIRKRSLAALDRALDRAELWGTSLDRTRCKRLHQPHPDRTAASVGGTLCGMVVRREFVAGTAGQVHPKAAGMRPCGTCSQAMEAAARRASKKRRPALVRDVAAAQEHASRRPGDWCWARVADGPLAGKRYRLRRASSRADALWEDSRQAMSYIGEVAEVPGAAGAVGPAGSKTLEHPIPPCKFKVSEAGGDAWHWRRRCDRLPGAPDPSGLRRGDYEYFFAGFGDEGRSKRPEPAKEWGTPPEKEKAAPDAGQTAEEVHDRVEELRSGEADPVGHDHSDAIDHHAELRRLRKEALAEDRRRAEERGEV